MIRSQAERLIRANRLVADGEALCRKQAVLLRWRRGRGWGWDTAAAEALLVRLELTRTRLYRARLRDAPAGSLAPDPDLG